MAKKNKQNDQEFSEDSAEIKSYLQTSEELYEDLNEDIEHLVSEADQQAPPGFNSSHSKFNPFCHQTR